MNPPEDRMFDDQKNGRGMIPRSAKSGPIEQPLPQSTFKKPWYKKKAFKIIFGFVLILLITLGAMFGYLYYQAESVVNDFSAGNKQIVVDEAKPELGKAPKNSFPGLKKVKTYLLLGSDVREATDPSDPGRTDTIMLVRIYPKEKAASILSLPRDLYIPIPGYGEDRINAAYTYGGTSLLIKTLREWLGVKIDHFVQIDFESFAELINELGGAYLPIDQRYYNKNDGSIENDFSEIDLKPGYQKLWGADTLSFVRYRHTDSDFIRAARQQLFMREIGRSLQEKKSSVLEYKDLIKTISKGTTSDIDSVKELLSLANTLREIPAENIVRHVMPATGAMIRGMSVVVPSEEDRRTALRDWDDPEKFIGQQEKAGKINWENNQTLSFLDLANTLATFSNERLSYYTNFYKKEFIKNLDRAQARYGSKKKIQAKQRELVDTTAPTNISDDQVFKHCVPTKLPSGYVWPDTDATNRYELKGYTAEAAYATAGSGYSILWMWTKWPEPTILLSPSDQLVIPGDKHIYRLFWESGKVRMISWQDGKVVSWITNTLQNDLDKREMIALATSCK